MHYIILALVFLSASVRAENSAKLFELRFGKHESYVLGTEHSLTVIPAKFESTLRDAIRSSDLIYLENDPVAAQEPREFTLNTSMFGPYPGYLGDKISSKTLEGLRQITGHHDQSKLLSIKPGVAIDVLETLFESSHAKLTRQFFTASRNFTNFSGKKVERFGDLMPRPELLEAATLLYGPQFGIAESAEMVSNIILEGPQPPPAFLDRGLDSIVFKIARAEGKRFAYLNTLERMDHEQAKYDLPSVADLESRVASLVDRLNPGGIGSQVIGGLFAQRLKKDLAAKFFDLRPERYRAIVRLIEDANDETSTLGAWISDRHVDWAEALIRDVKKGGVFIAAGAAHVIRGYGVSGEPTLLERFAASGIKVIPLDCDGLLAY